MSISSSPNWNLSLPVAGYPTQPAPANNVAQGMNGVAQGIGGVVQAISGVAQAVSGTPVAAIGGIAQQPVASTTPMPVGNTWGTWNGNSSTFDYAYDAYAFSKFPLSMGGPGFWGAGPVRRWLASTFSKVGEDRLYEYAIRAQFMKVPGMDPSTARLLQIVYAQETNGLAPIDDNAALRWFSQFSGNNVISNVLQQGPLMIAMGAAAAQCAVSFGFIPSVIGVNQIAALAQQAARIAPPLPAGTPFG